MNPTGRILIVDDEPTFLETYRIILSTEGYAVDAAADGPSALAKLEQPGWDLILLDRKLQGRYGPDTGLDLIQSILQRAPDVKVILVTGVADEDSVNRAFSAGAYDYLEKNAYFEAILKVKVRHALEAPRERRMAALANGKREEKIRELWKSVLTERDSSVKGALLEDLMALLFKSIPGFERTQTNRKSLDEQIDIVIPNESTAPFWQQTHSQYILGECKNWSKPVERRNWTSSSRTSSGGSAVADSGSSSPLVASPRVSRVPWRRNVEGKFSWWRSTKPGSMNWFMRQTAKRS
ncbi:response regulator [Cystobacter fuscus]